MLTGGGGQRELLREVERQVDTFGLSALRLIMMRRLQLIKRTYVEVRGCRLERSKPCSSAIHRR